MFHALVVNNGMNRGLALCLLTVFVLMGSAGNLLAQGGEATQKEIVLGDEGEEVVQTQITLDQILSGEEDQAGDALKKHQTPLDVKLGLDGRQIMMINESLKNAIEENTILTEEKVALENELEALKGQGEVLRSLRGQNEVRVNRIRSLTNERDEMAERIRELEQLKEEYEAQKIIAGETEQGEIEERAIQQEEEYSLWAQGVDDLLAQEEGAVQQEEALASASETLYAFDETDILRFKQQKELKKKARATLGKLENAAQRAVSKIAELRVENKQLQKDSSDLHYNLGNLFFEQGKYKRAVIEYKRVVELMPHDPAAHYNLAFVSGEFLDDAETALKHYQLYLYLDPDADDTPLVQEKILSAELDLKMRLDSPVDNLKSVE